MASQPIDRFLRLNAVLDRTGLSRATLYRKIAAKHLSSTAQDRRALLRLARIRNQHLAPQPGLVHRR
nr:AlpA family phage regulatory protein [Sphingopyxis sp. PET50]